MRSTRSAIELEIKMLAMMSYYVTEDKYSKPDQHDDLDRILKPHKAWNSMKLDANTYS
jgi:hypothetical protein